MLRGTDFSHQDAKTPRRKGRKREGGASNGGEPRACAEWDLNAEPQRGRDAEGREAGEWLRWWWTGRGQGLEGNCPTQRREDARAQWGVGRAVGVEGGPGRVGARVGVQRRDAEAQRRRVEGSVSLAVNRDLRLP